MDAQASATSCATPDVHGDASSPESQWLGEAVSTSDQTKLTDLPADVATASKLPAWYLAHGDADCQVTIGQAAELRDALVAKGVTPTYEVLAGAVHMDPTFEQTQLDPTVAFFAKALGAG